MIDVQATIKGAEKFSKGLQDEHKRHAKAMDTAVRVRGFKLMRLLRKELRQGAPGGRRLAPLSIMRRVWRASFSKTGRLGADRPLAALARAIGYEVPSGDTGKMVIGFVGRASSVTWRRLAKMHQEGFSTSTDAPFFRKLNISIEQYLRKEGSAVDHKLFGRRKARRRNVFFLKKGTRALHTPPRPIIDPFVAAHRSDALSKIRRDFMRKLRGERI